MSYVRSTPGKEVWGTSTYKIHLITTCKVFDESFNGTLILYERRWEKMKTEFTGLPAFVNSLKELWQESIKRGAIQETRLARWVEEYLTQEGIKVTYEDALKAIKGETVAVDILEKDGERLNKEIVTDFLSEEEKMDQSYAKKFIPVSEDVIPQVFSIKLDEGIDIEAGVDEFLSALAQKHKPYRAKEVKSKTTFRDTSGKERVMEKKVKVQESPTTGNTKMEGGLQNDFGFAIADIDIEDIIPFEFTVDDVKIEGAEVEERGRKVVEEGQVVMWRVPKLEVGEDVKINYYLGNRIMRTIVVQADDEVTLINTYEPIIRKTEKDLYAEAEFVNNSDKMLKTVKIMDQIPIELDLVSTVPDLEGDNKSLPSEDTLEVHWRFEEVLPESEYNIHYDLRERAFLVRDIYQVVSSLNEPILEVVKIVKNLHYQSGYGIILGLRSAKDISEEIRVIDKVAEGVNITIVELEVGDAAISTGANCKNLTWVLPEAKKGEIYHSFFRYKTVELYENTKLQIQVGEKETTPTSDAISKREQGIVVLPRQFYRKVDVRESTPS